MVTQHIVIINVDKVTQHIIIMNVEIVTQQIIINNPDKVTQHIIYRRLSLTMWEIRGRKAAIIVIFLSKLQIKLHQGKTTSSSYDNNSIRRQQIQLMRKKKLL